MSEHLYFMNQLKESIHADLNIINNLMNKKKLEYTKICARILEYEQEIEYEFSGNKVIINTDPFEEIDGNKKEI